ncbi:MAG: hypothetical protein ACM3RP_00645 [Chitinophagales bacterium]
MRLRVKLLGLPPLRIRTKPARRGPAPLLQVMSLRRQHLRLHVPHRSALALPIALVGLRRLVWWGLLGGSAFALATLFVGAGFHPAVEDAARDRLRR